MHHLYLSYQPSREQLSKERAALEGWCADRGVGDYAILEEKLTSGRISERMIRKTLNAVRAGDTVVATSLSRLGRGINMLQTVITVILENGASIYLMDEDHLYGKGPDSGQLLSHLDFAVKIAKKLKAERGNEALRPSREQGLPHGRPVGAKKAKSKLVLYGKTELIERLHRDGLSAEKIARQVGVSRTTIYNFLRTLK